MSCSKNSDRAGRTGGLKTGITAMSSKAGSIAGTLASGTARVSDAVANTVGQTVAPVSNRVLKAVDRPATVAANVVPALVTAAVYTQINVSATGPQQGRRPAVAVAVGLRDLPDLLDKAATAGRIKKGVGVAALAGGLVASVAADVTEQPWGRRKLVQRQKRFLLGERQVEVALTKSSLTPLLNRRDLLVSPRHVAASWGDMIHHGSTTWHRGTTIVKTAQGKRTLTHVRKLGLPSTSHYFERRLSDAEVAAIVSGQRKPHQMPGHVGTIGAMENLAPSWGQTKRAMILTRLHWPTPERSSRWDREPDPDAAKTVDQPAGVKQPPLAKTKIPARARAGSTIKPKA